MLISSFPYLPIPHLPSPITPSCPSYPSRQLLCTSSFPPSQKPAPKILIRDSTSLHNLIGIPLHLLHKPPMNRPSYLTLCNLQLSVHLTIAEFVQLLTSAVLSSLLNSFPHFRQFWVVEVDILDCGSVGDEGGIFDIDEDGRGRQG